MAVPNVIFYPRASKPYVGSREDARATNAIRYIDGSPCNRNHSPTIRLVSNKQCVACRDIKLAELKTVDPRSKNKGFVPDLRIRGLPVFEGNRTNAKKANATYYINPRCPCKEGHTPAIRLVSNTNCVQCNADWRSENAEHLTNYLRQRLIDDPLLYSKQGKKRYAENPEYFKARARQWASENRDHKNETGAIWKDENHEHLKAYWSDWAKTHPENVSAKAHKRRARKLGSLTHFTAEDVIQITEAQGHACAYCWIPITRKTMAVDHFIPLAREGSNGPENIVATCRPCNSRKLARMPADFLSAERERLLKKREEHPCPDRMLPLMPLLEIIDSLLNEPERNTDDRHS